MSYPKQWCFSPQSIVPSSHIGPLVLSASFSLPPSGEISTLYPTPGEPTLADTQFPSLSSRVIASLPGLSIDIESAIIGGSPFEETLSDTPSQSTKSEAQCAVTVLSHSHNALLTLYGGRIVQAVGIADVPTGGLHGTVGLSTQGGRHHLLTLNPTHEHCAMAMVHAVGMVGGVATWVQVGCEVTEGAKDAIVACVREGSGMFGTVMYGRDSCDGSLVVALGMGDFISHILRLDTTTHAPTLSLCCTLATPITVTAEDMTLSCSGGTAVLSYMYASPTGMDPCRDTCMSLRTGGCYESRVIGHNLIRGYVGSVFRDESDSLHLAVKDWMCVPLHVDAETLALVGTTLLYTERASTLHALDLSPLLETTMLASAPPHPTSIPLPLDKASLDVVGVAEYDCGACKWGVSLQLPNDVTTLPLVTDQALVVGECMYACMKGQLNQLPQLMSVPLGSTRAHTTKYPLSLTCQPRYDGDSLYMVLPTAAGDRRQRVNRSLALLGECSISVLSDGMSAVGECDRQACMEGVVCTEGGCFSVKGGVWLPMTEVRGGISSSPVELTSLEDVVSHLSRMSAGVVVSGVCLKEYMVGRMVEGWSFNKCSFTSLSHATLANCTFHECNMSGCDVDSVTLRDCLLSQCGARNITFTAGSTLVNVEFRDCNLDGSHLDSASPIVSGHNINLPPINMTNRTLTEDELEGVDVTCWDMSGSVISDCNLSLVEGLTVPHICSLSALTSCDLSDMDLKGVDLSGTDATGSEFIGANLSGAVFTGACLQHCNFEHSNLSGVRGLTERQLKSMSGVTAATISGVDMRGWDLSEVVLDGADLPGCQMQGAVVDETLCHGTQFPKGGEGPTFNHAKYISRR
ncbi:hypothetical protein KIPB_007503 [Kipferlia bialata]|uniref:Uncharacterized protein n=1 Tax=Kipferlia bialata TaxID=797122 RepID=A0A9K3D047_9EUKA|nr:hypothetical protein KIPB_007503 [Kipferlia bialata]|eukprot:g7503.t1